MKHPNDYRFLKTCYNMAWIRSMGEQPQWSIGCEHPSVN